MRGNYVFLFSFIVIYLCSAFTHTPSGKTILPPEVTNKTKASWYGPGFDGKLTANGEIFNMNKLTAAHKKLPFGTRVRITNLINGKSVVVRINDRGPYVKGRKFDLSKFAFSKIADLNTGVIKIKFKILE